MPRKSPASTRPTRSTRNAPVIQPKAIVKEDEKRITRRSLSKSPAVVIEQISTVISSRSKSPRTTLSPSSFTRSKSQKTSTPLVEQNTRTSSRNRSSSTLQEDNAAKKKSPSSTPLIQGRKIQRVDSKDSGDETPEPIATRSRKRTRFSDERNSLDDDTPQKKTRARVSLEKVSIAKTSVKKSASVERKKEKPTPPPPKVETRATRSRSSSSQSRPKQAVVIKSVKSDEEEEDEEDDDEASPEEDDDDDDEDAVISESEEEERIVYPKSRTKKKGAAAKKKVTKKVKKSAAVASATKTKKKSTPQRKSKTKKKSDSPRSSIDKSIDLETPSTSKRSRSRQAYQEEKSDAENVTLTSRTSRGRRSTQRSEPTAETDSPVHGQSPPLALPRSTRSTQKGKKNLEMPPDQPSQRSKEEDAAAAANEGETSDKKEGAESTPMEVDEEMETKTGDLEKEQHVEKEETIKEESIGKEKPVISNAEDDSDSKKRKLDEAGVASPKTTDDDDTKPVKKIKLDDETKAPVLTAEKIEPKDKSAGDEAEKPESSSEPTVNDKPAESVKEKDDAKALAVTSSPAKQSEEDKPVVEVEEKMDSTEADAKTDAASDKPAKEQEKINDSTTPQKIIAASPKKDAIPKETTNAEANQATSSEDKTSSETKTKPEEAKVETASPDTPSESTKEAKATETAKVDEKEPASSSESSCQNKAAEPSNASTDAAVNLTMDSAKNLKGEETNAKKDEQCTLKESGCDKSKENQVASTLKTDDSTAKELNDKANAENEKSVKSKDSTADNEKECGTKSTEVQNNAQCDSAKISEDSPSSTGIESKQDEPKTSTVEKKPEETNNSEATGADDSGMEVDEGPSATVPATKASEKTTATASTSSIDTDAKESDTKEAKVANEVCSKQTAPASEEQMDCSESSASKTDPCVTESTTPKAAEKEGVGEIEKVVSTSKDVPSSCDSSVEMKVDKSSTPLTNSSTVVTVADSAPVADETKNNKEDGASLMDTGAKDEKTGPKSKTSETTNDPDEAKKADKLPSTKDTNTTVEQNGTETKQADAVISKEATATNQSSLADGIESPKSNGVPAESLEIQLLSATVGDVLQRKVILNPGLDSHAAEDTGTKKFAVVSYNLQGLEGLISNHEKLLNELKQLETSVLCVQDVDSSYFENTLQPALKNLGYSGIYRKNKTIEKGMATMYLTTVFEAVDHKALDVHDLVKKDIEDSDLNDKEKEALTSYLDHSTFILYSKLKTLTGDKVCVCNASFPNDDSSLHAFQIAVAIRELTSQSEGSGNPHILCGTFNLEENSPAHQLLKDGCLSNDVVEDLKKRKNVPIPDKENAALVNLLQKCFQHSSSSLKSSYNTVLGGEPKIKKNQMGSQDSLWFSSDSLRVMQVLDSGAVSLDNDKNVHISLKAEFSFVN